jgi:hypothetical protein
MITFVTEAAPAKLTKEKEDLEKVSHELERKVR